MSKRTSFRVRARRFAVIIATTIVATVGTLTLATPANAATAGDIAAVANREASNPHGCGYYGGCPGGGWCAVFAKWVWARGGVKDLAGINGSAASFYRYGVARGQNPRRNAPQVGDAAVYGVSGNGSWAQHVNIVVAVSADGRYIKTVGGNESGRVSRMGWFNWRVTGPAGPVSGFVHPRGVTAGPANSGVHTLSIGDLNNDGRIDLAGRNMSNGNVVLARNVGAPGAIKWGAVSVIAAGMGWDQFDLGDLNNDGRVDIVGRKASNGNIMFLPNIGAPGRVVWGTPRLVAAGTGWDRISVGDLNNDGRKDLVVRARNGSVVLVPNIGARGTLKWGATKVVAPNMSWDRIAVGDLNNDGRTDLIGRQRSNGALKFLPGVGAPGSVKWGTSYIVAAGMGWDAFDVGDLNNDGKSDLVGRRTANGDVVFVRNVGAPGRVTWRPPVVVASGMGW